jgi:hypothetical protein
MRAVDTSGASHLKHPPVERHRTFAHLAPCESRLPRLRRERRAKSAMLVAPEPRRATRRPPAPMPPAIRPCPANWPDRAAPRRSARSTRPGPVPRSATAGEWSGAARCGIEQLELAAMAARRRSPRPCGAGDSSAATLGGNDAQVKDRPLRRRPRWAADTPPNLTPVGMTSTAKVSSRRPRRLSPAGSGAAREVVVDERVNLGSVGRDGRTVEDNLRL